MMHDEDSMIIPPADDDIVASHPHQAEMEASYHHDGLTQSSIPDHLSIQAGGDDDDDNWSRQVEMDEATTVGFIHEDSFRTESVLEHHDQLLDAGSSTRAVTASHRQLSLDDSLRINEIPQPPIKPELSMKEKLVLRERQRRIETERARLKRQFVLSGTSGANHDEDGDDDDLNGGSTSRRGEDFEIDHVLDGSIGDDEALRGGEGSIAEATLGEESTKAHPDDESPAHDESTTLGFNMERFLRSGDAFDPEVDGVNERKDGGTMNAHSEAGVVMERFLNNPIIVPPQIDDDLNASELNQRRSDDRGRVVFEGQRSVSFDIAGPTVEAMPSFGYDIATNTSIVSSTGTSAQGETTELDYVNAVDRMIVNTIISPSMDVQDATSNASDGMASEEPRFLRLTAADMEELAAIEEASIGNAPPSEREEEMLSEIGEMADFGGSHQPIGTDHTAASQDTPTTAMESASQISDGIAYHSHRLANITHHHPTSTSSLVDGNDDESTGHRSLDHLPLQSVSSHLLLSPGAISNQSVAVNPPSVVGVEEEIVLGGLVPILSKDSTEIVVESSDVARGAEERFDPISMSNEDIVDILRRSGFVSTSATSNVHSNQSLSPAIGLDPQLIHSAPPAIMNEFDVGKDVGHFVYPERSDGVNGLSRNQTETQYPVDQSKMLNPAIPFVPPIIFGSVSSGDKFTGHCYGSIEDGSEHLDRDVFDDSTRKMGYLGHEGTSLLPERVSPEIIKHKKESREISPGSGMNQYPSLIAWDSATRRISLKPDAAVQSAFDDVRSLNERDGIEMYDVSRHYLGSGAFNRAFPERQLALMVTLALEIPVLLAITGGSDALCQLVGRKKYHLLIGMLPLTCAISGNVGLQASTLTTRAISHAHVTEKSYGTWLLKEIGTAIYLGFGMGLIMGSIACISSGYDFPFTVTIFSAQLISIITAGITGTLAPLIFSFIFHRDAGKWSGPLETAIQDIVGSFAMMIISYRILLMFGHRSVEPDDMCFAS